MIKLQYLFLAGIIFCMTATSSYGKWVWNKETGWMESPSTAISTLDQRYKYALSLLVEQKYTIAVKEFESIISTAPDSEYAEASQINIGWAYFLNSDYKRALKAYEKVLQKYPGTKRTEEILRREYQVGVAQMDTNEEAAIGVFEKIIEKHHLGPIASDAQVKIADCYFKLGQYEEALDAYEKFLENYPKSEWVPYVQYQIPLSKVHHEKQQERNYGLLISAREGFEEYLVSNPQGIHAEDAKRIIEEIRIIEAEREFNIGEFYLRVKKPASAAMYFEYVKADFPDTIWAERANEKIEFLRMIEAIK
ncbi:MAG: outer membrane protein assembly factor BamD [Candidatus Brocadia sp. AMX2]|nr:outer membrane protein assembly factor BamD [Candidatus Brocadia sp. AMX2]MBC6932345.1 outer membrane protein assembly factor BamD [Candidatus Brocadia sp.]MBL1169839.1 outer membrane protein assembly factor BamD [Candidatus Brocadia sp. AMX1]KAA0243755.1 MAG: outer membrane protein assembly factor BamD [Candidatus Brocadia sp. AMX2]MCE7866734.1 outer membrane protein assembly factor BamD [Candidatus Brocadia sp. AMX2]MCQ3917440.1 outer membrane protein assembly factor BamD [Candidatus Broc